MPATYYNILIVPLLPCPDGTSYGPYPGRGNFGVPSSFHVNFCARMLRAAQPVVGSRIPWYTIQFSLSSGEVVKEAWPTP